MKQKAIITGDIVSSQKIEPGKREQLYTDVGSFLNSLKGKWITSYETYRGDSLQCEVKATKDALRVALIIRTYMMAYSSQKSKLPLKKKRVPSKGYFNNEFDIRLAVGIGAVDFIKRKKITSSDGEAFRFSGEALDSLKDENQRLVCKTNSELFDKDIEPVIILLDALAQKWTQNQAELVLNKLYNKKDEEIATELGISIPAINQRKKTAQWFAIEKAVQFFEYKTTNSL
ncbi:hypothetical protein F5148DRAFT_1289408 [Russula earlei]|uniref:Uncharacterized protein n=1 Tax=Russula earlei TaxID=71964 RepID=A0ACC0TXK9_9AGAM|nr:hypothetical protein F5148DRAFT_1289408 [Russula earlei]